MLVTFIIVYMVATMAVGFIATKYISSVNDYINTGRRLPAFFNAFALFALWFGAETIFGAAGRFLEAGMIGVIEEPFGATLCLILFGLILARPLYRKNILTIADLFRDAYGAKVELLSSIFMLLTYIGYVAAQMVALGILFQLLLGFELSTGIIIASAVVTTYTFAGGMWAVTITDFIQSIMIIIGLLVLSCTLFEKVGGFEPLINQMPDDFFRFLPEPHIEDINEWVTAWLVVGLGSLASQDVFQRINSAKSEKVAVRSTYIGAAMYLLFSALPLFIALCVRVLEPERIDAGTVIDFQSIVPEIALLHTGPVVQILFLGALVSAVLSTCSGALLAPSAILAENIISPMMKLRGKGQLGVSVIRMCVLILSVASTILALNQNDIYKMVGDSGGLGLVSILVPTLYAIYAKKPSAGGAVGSIFMGAFIWISKDYSYLFYKPYYDLPVSSWILGSFASVGGYYLGRYTEQRLERRRKKACR